MIILTFKGNLCFIDGRPYLRGDIIPKGVYNPYILLVEKLSGSLVANGHFSDFAYLNEASEPVQFESFNDFEDFLISNFFFEVTKSGSAYAEKLVVTAAYQDHIYSDDLKRVTVHSVGISPAGMQGITWYTEAIVHEKVLGRINIAALFGESVPKDTKIFITGKFD